MMISGEEASFPYKNIFEAIVLRSRRSFRKFKDAVSLENKEKIRGRETAF